MFRKCLKYDLRAFGKIWLIAAVIMLALAVICGLGLASFGYEIMDFLLLEELNPDAEPGFLFYTNLFLGMICYMLIIASVAVFTLGTNIANHVRYYTHFFTDQGYLTFTLPVKRSTLFWSKATSAFIYDVGAILVSGLAAIICLVGIGGGFLVGIIRGFIVIEGYTLFEILSWITWEGIASVASTIWDFIIHEIGMLNVFRVLFILFLSVLLLLSSSFSAQMTGYFCITIGATLFRKLKLLGALVAYYVFNNVLSVPFAYIGSYYGMFAAMLGSTAIPKLFENIHIGMSVIYLIMIILIIMNVTVGLAMAFFSIWRLDKKLNLA